MNVSAHKTKVIFSLSLCFSLLLILSNLIASSRLLVTPYFILPGGVLLYPLTFVISNIVNESFGASYARLMVLNAFAGNLLALCLVKALSLLPAASPEVSHSWSIIFDISPLAFFSSLIAFTVSQRLDITLFQFFKHHFPQSPSWLRSYFSSSLSQIIDTFIVDIGVIYIGMHYSFTQTLQIMSFSYLYKHFFNLLSSPLFYFAMKLFRNNSKQKKQKDKKKLFFYNI